MHLPSIGIDASLQDRLSLLAEREGTSLAAFADTVSRNHAEAAERAIEEEADDEKRWQRYRETGHSVPVETVREKLRLFAAKAAKAECGATHKIARTHIVRPR